MAADLTSGKDFSEIALPTAPTPFERIGGEAVVDALVERFYAEMDARPAAREIRALHPENLEPIKFVLKRYLGEWLGGPPLYSRDRGHPRLRMRHLKFPIGEPERDAWLACMSAALEAEVADAEAREAILRALAGLADHMRNQPGAEAPAALVAPSRLCYRRGPKRGLGETTWLSKTARPAGRKRPARRGSRC